uniref:Putative secreted protein n=1 Tax=Ixodes ricinus TaxID=34613 RepID=A0A6B0U4H1_IXORI
MPSSSSVGIGLSLSASSSLVAWSRLFSCFQDRAVKSSKKPPSDSCTLVVSCASIKSLPSWAGLDGAEGSAIVR